LAAFLVKAHRDGNWKKAAKELRIETEALVTRMIPLDETLPWDTIDGGERARLVKEYNRAFPMDDV
jgi:hypothetical protein